MPPLNELLVLDFGTLLPGPLASLFLCEAGARVVKVERPDGGDEMRRYVPAVAGPDSANFHMLNRGKESLALNLKDKNDRAALNPWLKKADILIEQFRPGAMARMGLDYESVRKINPRIIYCSITGWGQSGDLAQRAAHDVNFIAQSGLAGRTLDAEGDPQLPPVLAADIAAGSMPAVINILLALIEREKTGRGAYIDIAMSDALPMFAYADLGEGFATGHWTAPNRGLTNGGTPRYQYYRTLDGRHLAAAPLEDKFWARFCQIIGLSRELRDAGEERTDEVRTAVASIIAQRTAEEWFAIFGDEDVCCNLVQDFPTAIASQHNKDRGVFDRLVELGALKLPALPVPIAPIFRSQAALSPAPRLGEHRDACDFHTGDDEAG